MNSISVKQFEKMLKDALKDVATKDDLKSFATKDDLKELKKELIKEIRDAEGFVTVNADKYKADKADLKTLEERVDKIEQKIAN
jgi:hypothetical protein